jgi:hypothetical protein
VTDMDEDFKATVEDIAADAKDIARIEERKEGLQPSDPAAVRLSVEAEELAEQLHEKTLVERNLAESASRSA